MDWIKCTDKLPDTYREVFAFAEGFGIYYTARFAPGAGRWLSPEWPITHWAERPAPPKEEA